jgi:DNA polymerase
MPEIGVDVETRSVLDLLEVGAHRYAANATTEMRCVGFAVDDAPPALWTPGQPCPEIIRRAVVEGWTFHAFNAQFEVAIWHYILAPRLDWPEPRLEQWRCTMAAALAFARPGALKTAAEALGLELQKDAGGARLIRLLCRPRRPRAGEDPSKIYWHEATPDELERFHKYCRRDVEVEREVRRRVPPLSDAEQQLWQLDAVVNARGFHVDTTLAGAAHKITRDRHAAINRELTELTGGRITSIAQVGKISNYLKERGHNVTSITKRSVAAVLAHKPSDDVARLLQLRQEGGKSSTSKLATLFAMVNGERIRGTLRFHGAATGRWSGAGFQPHNLIRVQPADSEAAIAAVLSGDLERVSAIGPPLETISTLSRSMICAAPGKVLIIADYSTIEPRVLSWLAGEKWKLDGFRHFDATGDLAFENYCLVASRVLKRKVTPDDTEDRQKGKYMDLAFGYGGALGAFRKIAPDADFTDAEVETFKRDWRTAHPKTVQFWTDLQRTLLRAVRTGTPVEFNKFKAEMRSGDLYLFLPSGRAIVYPETRIEPGQYSANIIFKDNARGKWEDYRGWHGTFTENVVQAISRDLLTAAMQRIEAAGYPIVLHVHDDVVAEVPETFGSPEEFSRLMTELPPWAADLPLVAKADRRERYAKGSPTKPPADSPSIALELAPVAGEAQRMTQAEFDEINAGLIREGIAPLTARAASEAPPLEGLTASSPEPTQGNGRDTGEPVAGKILCPFHDDHSPSLHIYPGVEDPHYHCFACGAHGHLNELNDLEIDWQAALKSPIGAPADGAEIERNLERAHELWNEAEPIAGTLAERYLAESRGIDVAALPESVNEVLRFLPRCWHDGQYHPCLIALFRDIETGQRAGVHRTWLTADAQKIDRRMFGRWSRPRAIKLWPADNRLFVGEGIETALAAATQLGMRPAWALGSKVYLGKLPVISGVDELTILVDHDSDGEAAAIACDQTWRDAGRRVRLLRTKDAELNDFNDLILKTPRADWNAGFDEVENAAAQPACAQTNSNGALVFIDMSRWDFEPTPEQEWIAYNRIPRRECVLFSGEGGAGKSIEQLHLSIAATLGLNWLGVTPEQGPAIFIDAEDDEKVLHRRTKAIAAHYDVSIADMIEGGLHVVSWRGCDAALAVTAQNGKIQPTPLYQRLLEAAGDIKPVIIGIAASANVFAGNENDRAQVQQFVGLLTRVAMAANGSVVLISHPSLTGINTETGLSGTTQWHNSVRARYFMRGVKPEAGEPLDTDLREIVFKKNNYGSISETIVLRWNNGLFLPVGTSADQAAKETIAQDVFLALLKRLRSQNRYVSDKPSQNYAPTTFAKEDEAKRAGLTKRDLERAMRLLFQRDVIWNEPVDGKPSRRSYRIAPRA